MAEIIKHGQLFILGELKASVYFGRAQSSWYLLDLDLNMRIWLIADY